jgi:hypothetical protein
MQITLKYSHEGSRVKTIFRMCKLLDRISQGNPDITPSHGIDYRLLADYYTRILKAEVKAVYDRLKMINR